MLFKQMRKEGIFSNQELGRSNLQGETNNLSKKIDINQNLHKNRPGLSNESQDLLERLSLLKMEMQKKITDNQPIRNSTRERNRETNNTTQKSTQKNKIEEIRSNIIGFNTRYTSPFNIELEAVYVDHTATNRPYRTVEDMVRYAKKFAANPHTEFSHFGKYSTEMMHYAQSSLLRSFNAEPRDFVALPTGSGSTGAIEKALKIIHQLQSHKNSKPVIYLTPYEHHSNILPWVEFYDKIEVLSCDNFGNLDLAAVEEQLSSSPSDNLIVSVSAASNVTSTLTDLITLNTIIKTVRKQKKVIFGVDCAAFCCHHELDLKIYDQIDFVYLSPHKNLGGAESCGVLVARKETMVSTKPTFPGGGTVSFVKGYTKTDVMYDVDIFNREIAGTPPFIGFYRAALSFELLKNTIGYEFIHQREVANTALFVKMINEANERFKLNGNSAQIVIYGDPNPTKRANVVTFNIMVDGKILQHNLVSLILADIFGIQLRSGCFCAGPFGVRLLNLDANTVSSIEEEVGVGVLTHKPGYLRLDLTFYLELYEIEYVVKSIIGVAEYRSNLNIIYSLCNDGEIKRHRLFKDILNDKYSLSNVEFIQQELRDDQVHEEERLSNRRQTLIKQFDRGMEIVKKPIEFLKSQISR